jgi:protein SCO1/2
MPSAARTTDEEGRPARSVFRSPFLWAFLAGVILLTLMRPLMRFEPEPPPVLGHLPEFRLTAADGEPFGSAELEGGVWVANFFFSRCPSICPKLTDAMRRLQERYVETGTDGIHLVSISVDPDYDTPERLMEYGAAHGVDPARWTLLTGEFEAIRDLVYHGFRTPLGEPDPEGNLVDIAHSTKFVLVDQRRGIRGYYETDATGLDEIYHRSRRVLKEAKEG